MTTYPKNWIICNPDEAKDGNVIPLFFPSKQSNQPCINCGLEPPGEVFGWHVGMGHSVKFFKNNHIYGTTIHAPCPVCGGSIKEYLWQASGLAGKFLDGKLSNQITTALFNEFPGNAAALSAMKCFVSGATNCKIIPWLYISGSNGIGKTHLMWSACNMLIAADKTVHYCSLKQILDDIKNTYDAESAIQTAGVKRKYIDIGVLFIDEFEKDGWTDWASNEIFEILNERGMQNRPTMICSNKSLQELEFDKFKSMISRFQTGMIVSMSGEDMRKTIEPHWNQ
jgi:hypothetical protein